MQIAFITPELFSLVRRTNLAGVAESLAQALQELRQDVRVFLPWTLDVDTTPLGNLSERGSVDVQDGEKTQTFRILEGQLAGVPVYLFENETFFGSRHPYGDKDGPYTDNWRRFALFSRAVLGSMDVLKFQPEILHCLDWTTGLIPLLHRLEYVEKQPDHPLSKAGTYFAIHNLAMQGAFERDILPHIGVPFSWFRSVEGIELGGRVNYLKAGAEFATILGTHSPAHALKIQERDRGYGLEETFERRKKELIGIHNGIDYKAWDPSTDPCLAAKFSPDDKELAGKRKCKSALQAMLRLDNGPRTPVACAIGRWDADCGFDILVEILTQILERNVEVVLMGQGSREISQRLTTWEKAFVGRLRVIEGYNARTAHMMMGGSDLLLMPSHYQPASPFVAIAMRYGVLPIVYAKSGLEDTVVDYHTNPKGGTGFHFPTYTTTGLLDCMHEVIQTYRDAPAWKTIVSRALQQDFSWNATATEYQKAYRRVSRRVKQRAEHV